MSQAAQYLRVWTQKKRPASVLLAGRSGRFLADQRLANYSRGRIAPVSPL